MKKTVTIILMMALLLGSVQSVFAESKPEIVQVKIDGEIIQVQKVNVEVNGKLIQSDVPSILYDSRTLVPIRFIAEELGAKVGWNQEKFQAEVTYQNKEILITIDSDIVTINGKEKNLPYNVPAKIANDRTMVPLRFIAEEFGTIVDWNQETFTALITSEEVENAKEKEVTGILMENNGTISIRTNAKVTYKDVMYDEEEESDKSDKLVIDIENSKLSDELRNKRGLFELEVNQYSIKEIRASQFSIEPNITRLVIDMDKASNYDITYSEDGKELRVQFIDRVIEIDLNEKTEETEEVKETDNEIIESNGLNKVTQINFDKIDKRKGVVIHNTDVPKYNIFRLSEPDRVVIDLKDSILETNENKLEYTSDYIAGIRVSQFKPDDLYDNTDDIVRMVFDLKETDKKPNITMDVIGGKLVVYIDNQEMDNITYKKDEHSKSITVDTKVKTDYSVKHNEKSGFMEVKIPKENVNLKNGIQAIDDEYVSHIFVEDQSDYKRVLIKFKQDIDYKVNSDKNDDEINISFDILGKKIETPEEVKPHKNKLIIIDAGHGGKDPGAIGPNLKIKEKDLVLKMAFKLNDKLIEAGFKTLLTRDTDEYIGLYERAAIANKSDGDAFISLHFNAHPDKDIDGIQTLYCPAYDSTVKNEDMYPFAEAIHQGILHELGTEDRGIRKRPGLVVTRETKMVAVIAELGFMTNPKEEKSILTSSYQDKAVRGIVNGLIKYFDK